MNFCAHPAKNALKGKLVTRMQYKNCMTPESIRNTRKESMNLSRPGVVSTYARQSVSTALPLSAKPAFALEAPGALTGVPAADLGAMVVESAYRLLRERVRTRRGVMGRAGEPETRLRNSRADSASVASVRSPCTPSAASLSRLAAQPLLRQMPLLRR